MNDNGPKKSKRVPRVPGKIYGPVQHSTFERQMAYILANGVKKKYARFIDFFEGRASVTRRPHGYVFCLTRRRLEMAVKKLIAQLSKIPGHYKVEVLLSEIPPPDADKEQVVAAFENVIASW